MRRDAIDEMGEELAEDIVEDIPATSAEITAELPDDMETLVEETPESPDDVGTLIDNISDKSISGVNDVTEITDPLSELLPDIPTEEPED